MRVINARLFVHLQIKLAEHTYSNLFGTFLCNSNRERQVNGVPSRTFSVWKYLNAPQFRNYLYDNNFDKVGLLDYIYGNFQPIRMCKPLLNRMSCAKKFTPFFFACFALLGTNTSFEHKKLKGNFFGTWPIRF